MTRCTWVIFGRTSSQSGDMGGGCHMNIILSAEGNHSPPSTLTHLCCPRLTACALFVFTAPMSTRLNEQASSACRHEDALRVCVYACAIMCHWCRTVAITCRQRGLPDGVSAVQEGRCAAFIKLTVPGSQERLTHCGWGMAEQRMQPHAPLCIPVSPFTHSYLPHVCVL